MNIASSFEASGIVTAAGIKNIQSGASSNPSSFARILSFNKHWKDLTTEKAEFVMAAIPTLSDVCARYNLVPEVEFDRVLSQEEGIDNSRPIVEGNNYLPILYH